MAYSAIVKPSDYFNTVTYTGTAGGQTISGVGHQPDFIWVKQRGDAGYDHSLHNSVSGLLKQLISNSTAAEITNTDTITSNNSDGFVLGADTAGPNANANNQDTKNYVAWNWKAGTSQTLNTGNVTSIVNFNTTAGFSIVSWTGTAGNILVSHGLGAVPKMIIFKNRSATQEWAVYHASLGPTKYLELNQTGAAGTATNRFNNSNPDATDFIVSSDASVNGSGNSMIAYCFAEKQGYSKFGSYTGNGSTDGPFVYTGFKPAFVMTKRTDDSGGWALMDNKRPGFNLTNDYLIANGNNSEADDGSFGMDLLSNGWKARYNNTHFNADGGNYIFMAFAEEPLVANSGTDGVPATAG